MIAAALLFVGVAAVFGAGSSPIKEARKAKDPSPLVDELAKKDEPARPTSFNKTFQLLWEAYDRDLAAQFLKASMPLMADARIVQYWIKQIMEVEPEISQEVFDTEFLTRFYRPDIAASCGRFG